jgi:hypothetical protein
VTQRPTCQIAALLYALVSDAEGPYQPPPPSLRKPLSVSDILPGQASHLATNDPERELPLAWPEANPTRVRPERSLGTQIGLGRGRQNERDLAMVEDPPIDLEEVVVGIRLT